MHWQFLELSLPTDDVQASLDFYRVLGFTELLVGDIRSYPYAVVSDGRVAIGLHADALPAPALSFVQTNAARWARQLEAAGFELAFQRLGEEDFHEFALHAPGGQLAVVMEAPTFARRSIRQTPPPATGPSSYIEMCTPDVPGAVQFWSLAGLMPSDESNGDQAELAAPELRLRVSGGRSLAPRLHFAFPDSDQLQAAIERLGTTIETAGERAWIRAPEGTIIEIRTG